MEEAAFALRRRKRDSALRPADAVKRRSNYMLRCGRLTDVLQHERKFIYSFRVSRRSRIIAAPLSEMSAVIGYKT